MLKSTRSNGYTKAALLGLTTALVLSFASRSSAATLIDANFNDGTLDGFTTSNSSGVADFSVVTATQPDGTSGGVAYSSSYSGSSATLSQGFALQTGELTLSADISAFPQGPLSLTLSAADGSNISLDVSAQSGGYFGGYNAVLYTTGLGGGTINTISDAPVLASDYPSPDYSHVTLQYIPSATPGSGTVNVYFGGISSADLALSQTVDASSAATTFDSVSIVNNTASGGYLYIDNVDLTSGAVPEPSSVALLLASGLVALVGLNRFRNRSGIANLN